MILRTGGTLAYRTSQNYTGKMRSPQVNIDSFTNSFEPDETAGNEWSPPDLPQFYIILWNLIAFNIVRLVLE